MSSTRPTLIQLLTEAFKDPVTKYTCCTASLRFLKKGLVNRLFDHLPTFIDQTEIDILTSQFTHIL